MTEISREQYQAAVDAFVKALEAGDYCPRAAADIMVHALGLRVAATPEERIAKFITAARSFNGHRSNDPAWTMIDYHFPEVAEP